MAIAFVNNANNKVTGATSNTVAAYTSRAVDDIVILAMYAEGIAGALTWPTGFTEMAAIASANNDHKIWAAWRRVTGSEPTYTVSWTGSALSGLVAAGWSGCITTGDPQDATATTSAPGSTVNIPIPAITTATDNAISIAIGGSFSLDTPGAAGGSYTTRVTYTTGDLIIADQIKATAGAIGATQWVDIAATQVTGITIALKPAVVVSAQPRLMLLGVG
jgi:hypothetical protein